MQLTWVLYLLTLSILAGAAAVCLERVLRRFRRSTRWAWVAALAVSSGGGLGAFLFPRRADGLTFGLADLATGSGGLLYGAVTGLRELQWTLARRLPDLSGIVHASWALALVAVAVWLAHGSWTLRRRREQWEEGDVAGRECLISRRTGPAVTGVFRNRLVVPTWVEELPPEQREMVLRHEEEHMERRDPWLLAVAYGALLLFPWNPVLWWQVGRLRLAVELDCDRRVARRITNRELYGELLLAVGRRRSPAPAAAFARGESHTGARIRELMEPERPGSSGVALRAAGALLAASLLLLTPRPITPYRAEAPPASLAEVDPTPHDRAPECLNCGAVEDSLARSLRDGRTPPSRERVGVGIQITGEGTVRHAVPGPGQELAASGHGRAVRRAALSLRFEPARLNGDTVTVWVYQIFDLEEPPPGE